MRTNSFAITVPGQMGTYTISILKVPSRVT